MNNYHNCEMKEDIKSLVRDVGEIKITMAVNTQSLQEHMRRCDLLEEDIKCNRKFQYMAIGSISVITFIAPFIVSLLSR